MPASVKKPPCEIRYRMGDHPITRTCFVSRDDEGKRRGCPVAVLFLRQCLRRQRICGNIISGIHQRSDARERITDIRGRHISAAVPHIRAGKTDAFPSYILFEASERMTELQTADLVHFNEEGFHALAKIVVDAVKTHLSAKVNK